jgi:hypothetical protein
MLLPRFCEIFLDKTFSREYMLRSFEAFVLTFNSPS